MRPSYIVPTLSPLFSKNLLFYLQNHIYKR